MNNKTKQLALNGVIAAIYALLTIINPLSFGVLQLRVSTLLLPLAIFIPQVRVGLILGTAIGNLNSALGIIDIVVGTIITAITVCIIAKASKYIQPLLYALISGILVSLQLYYVFKAPILYSIFTVGISGFILYTVGIPICKTITKSLHHTNIFNNPCSYCNPTKQNCNTCPHKTK